MGALKDVVRKQIDLILETYLPKFCILQFVFIHVLRWNIMMHILKVLLTIILHAISNHAQLENLDHTQEKS